jgi:hypothetical protein
MAVELVVQVIVVVNHLFVLRMDYQYGWAVDLLTEIPLQYYLLLNLP